MGNFEPSQKKSSHTASSPIATNLFRSRSFSKPSATAEAVSTDTPDFQARLDFARSHAPNLSRLAANSSGDRPSTIQTKLTIGQPNDQYEQEANRVADQVMSMPDAAISQSVQREAMPDEEELRTKPLASSITPLVQREAMPDEEELRTKPAATLQREAMPEDEESVQGKDLLQRSPDGNLQAGEGIESRLNQSKGGGSPLSDEVRSFMEPRFGADFSQVRVHTGSEAVQMNRDLNAQAFTHQQDVYFGAGKASTKDALTAHELTHVVQQTGRGSDKPTQTPLAIQQKCSACEEDSLRRVVDLPVTPSPLIQMKQVCDQSGCYEQFDPIVIEGDPKAPNEVHIDHPITIEGECCPSEKKELHEKNKALKKADIALQAAKKKSEQMGSVGAALCLGGLIAGGLPGVGTCIAGGAATLYSLTDLEKANQDYGIEAEDQQTAQKNYDECKSDCKSR